MNVSSRRGDYPLGVYFSKKSEFFCSGCYFNKEHHYLGHFNNSEEAFFAYKKFKEEKIKEVAEQYKDKIPDKLYRALLRYEIEITD